MVIFTRYVKLPEGNLISGWWNMILLNYFWCPMLGWWHNMNLPRTIPPKTHDVFKEPLVHQHFRTSQDMLAYSGSNMLCIKTGSFPPHMQKLQGAPITERWKLGGWLTLWLFNSLLLEMAHLYRWFTRNYLLKMAILHSYVSLPEGKRGTTCESKGVGVEPVCQQKVRKHINHIILVEGLTFCWINMTTLAVIGVGSD